MNENLTQPDEANVIDQNEISYTVFKHPFTCMLAGPSKSGKTTLLKKILQLNNILIDKQPTRIVYCYSIWQPAFNELRTTVSPTIEFVQGLPDIDEFSSSETNLLILDDLMRECGKDSSICKIFTVDSHHKNISVFFITQNLFSKEKNTRTINLNCNYLIIFNNPRDRTQISFLARQMYPEQPKFLLECYQDAVENKQYGYLLIDLTQSTQPKFRVQTGIIPVEDERIIYQPKFTY
jgi:energy-coupling factor transporter ATP-binding protein EcfA2